MNGFELTKAAIHAPSLNTSERMIFAVVCDAANEKGEVYACSQETIAERSGCSERTVRSALAVLESRHWIRRVRRTRQHGERGVDRIIVTPNGKDGKLPAFKLLEIAAKPVPVVEPSQRMMPLPAVVGGSEREPYRQPLPVNPPPTGNHCR